MAHKAPGKSFREGISLVQDLSYVPHPPAEAAP